MDTIQTHPSTQSRPRSLSRSRPTTPLRPPSRTSTIQNPNILTSSTTGSTTGSSLTALDVLEPQFAELADSMADLEANFMHLQLMHESLARFGESFGAFLYGLNVRAFCVDFPEAPVQESFERWKNKTGASSAGSGQGAGEGETTFMSTDTAGTSFVEQGSTTISSRAMSTTPRRAPPPVTPGRTNNSTRTTDSTRTTGTGTVTGGYGRGGAGGRGGGRGTRASGLARPRGRGIK